MSPAAELRLVGIRTQGDHGGPSGERSLERTVPEFETFQLLKKWLL